MGQKGISLIVNIFFIITFMIYGSYEIFISNYSDFSFSFLDFWWVPILSSIFYLIVAMIVLCILPEKISSICNYSIFSFTLCCYIQTMFLNGKMKVLNDESIEFGIRTKIINVIIWILIWCAIFFFWKYYKEICDKFVSFLSFAIIAMQMVALVSLLFSTDVLNQKKEGYLTTENMLSLSDENSNVVVFILDTFDGRYMESILEEEPTYLDRFSDFTYFPNALSTHSRTYPAITYLLTGEKCYFDKSPQKYVNQAFEGSIFLPTLAKKNVDIGLYTYVEYLGDDIKKHVGNYLSSTNELKIVEVQKALIKIVLYRDMPYVFKDMFCYDINNINYKVSKVVDRYKNSDDEWFYNQLIEKRIQNDIKESTFRFYHLYGCHTDLSQPIYYGKRSIDIVYEYILQMKDKGVYDNSMIIITTDHAVSGSGDTLDIPHKTAVPLFLVKPIGKVDKPFTISNAPIAQEDFIPTVLDGFEIETDEKSIFEYEEDDERERFYYYTALYSDEEGEIELREYKVVGDARNKENYEFTGNTWPVLYSLNKVKQ